MKYVAWLNDTFKYKINILSKLSLLQIKNLLILFCENRAQIEYIVTHKLYGLLDMSNSCDLLKQYKNSDLIKIYKLSQIINLQTILKMIIKIDIQRITKHNVKSILKYVDDANNFINKKVTIEWGPGNHGDTNTNINEHYKKHVLSETENQYWSLLVKNSSQSSQSSQSNLSTLDCKSYENYAIESFYKMKNVMIHSNGKGVYMSGFYGNVFIIGRYHNSVFGISSCYYVENGEKNGRLKDLCFSINFS